MATYYDNVVSCCDVCNSKFKYTALSYGLREVNLLGHKVVTVCVVHVFTVLLDRISNNYKDVAPKSVETFRTGKSVRILLVADSDRKLPRVRLSVILSAYDRQINGVGSDCRAAAGELFPSVRLFNLGSLCTDHGSNSAPLSRVYIIRIVVLFCFAVCENVFSP